MGNLMNPEKALRILRTCVVQALDAQIDYYEMLPSYRKEWVRELQHKTIDSLLGLCRCGPVENNSDLNWSAL